jgi:isopentenyl diphosphate isomerase/L-lactate dehydrogenase-like FMN-dependent dehydrogenase
MCALLQVVADCATIAIRPEGRMAEASFGQAGAEAVLNISDTELTNIMRQAGTPSIAAIDGAHLVRSR